MSVHAALPVGGGGGDGAIPIRSISTTASTPIVSPSSPAASSRLMLLTTIKIGSGLLTIKCSVMVLLEQQQPFSSPPCI